MNLILFHNDLFTSNSYLKYQSGSLDLGRFAAQCHIDILRFSIVPRSFQIQKPKILRKVNANPARIFQIGNKKYLSQNRPYQFLTGNVLRVKRGEQVYIV